jgi:hypothetical protein
MCDKAVEQIEEAILKEEVCENDDAFVYKALQKMRAPTNLFDSGYYKKGC